MVAAIDSSENLALRSESSFIYTPQATHVVASEIMIDSIANIYLDWPGGESVNFLVTCNDPPLAQALRGCHVLTVGC
jgi:hypothetical protein